MTKSNEAVAKKEGDLKIRLPAPPVIKISWKAMRRLQYYISQIEQEISGLGKVELKDNYYLITEVFLFEQEVTSTTTDLSEEGIATFLEEMMEKGEDTTKIRCWWHSHADMDTFWSGIDESTIDRLGNDYLVSIVINKKGKARCRLDQFSPFRIVLDNLPLMIKFPDNSKLKKECKEEIEEKVKTGASSSFDKLKGVIQKNVFPDRKDEEGEQ